MNPNDVAAIFKRNMTSLVREAALAPPLLALPIRPSADRRRTQMSNLTPWASGRSRE